jgi:hypothetical protein
VQSNEAAAFTEEDISIIQILADQLALAIENTRLLAESQQSLRELESLYGMKIRQGWNRRLAGEPLVYSFDRQSDNVRRNAPAQSATAPDGAKTRAEGESDGQVHIRVPIELRGQRIGNLWLRRSQQIPVAEKTSWSAQAEELARETASQLALSLENARLMEEIQSHASQEELINQIVARTQSSLNLETVMKTAVTEIGRLMRLSKIELRLGTTGSKQEAPDDGNAALDDGSGTLPPDQPQAELEETGQ